MKGGAILALPLFTESYNKQRPSKLVISSVPIFRAYGAISMYVSSWKALILQDTLNIYEL